MVISMKINQTADENKVILALEGRLDTTTACELETAVKEAIQNTDDLIMDFRGLDYLSSAGLRVILGTQKQMNCKKGKLTIRNVNDVIMEVFAITGFVDILSIE